MKKSTTRKPIKKRTPESVIVMESRIAAKDTLFPEKVAKANNMLKHTRFHPSLGL
jgi:hypothetical protein